MACLGHKELNYWTGIVEELRWLVLELTDKLSLAQLVCSSVLCVCVCEREREKERERFWLWYCIDIVYTVNPLVYGALNPKTWLFLVSTLSLPNPSKLGVKLRMKMQLEQRQKVMLQLHMSDEELYCQLRCPLY